ncbi:MAG: hypothetical protein ACREIT_02210 [Tepidisphaeraceae bacterium]
MYLTTQQNGEHHVAVPLHNPLKIGTFAVVLVAVAGHLGMERETLLRAMKL